MCSCDALDRLLTLTPIRPYGRSTGPHRGLGTCACVSALHPLHPPPFPPLSHPRASTPWTRVHDAAPVRRSFWPEHPERIGRGRGSLPTLQMCPVPAPTRRCSCVCVQEELKRSLARNVRKSSWLYILPEGKEDQSTQLNIAKVPLCFFFFFFFFFQCLSAFFFMLTFVLTFIDYIVYSTFRLLLRHTHTCVYKSRASH